MSSVVLCHMNCCNAEGVRLPATRVLAQSVDQGVNVSYFPCCDTHAATWWDGSDWDGRHLEQQLMDVLTLEDFVASHGFGDATQEGIQLAQSLIASGDDYATAAAEVTARGLTEDPDN
ncbi:hypothetical protein [Pseudomonas arcuscaelestis]|uniref:hypothetical protein n=1 Tax=Pseudomonas arcuscaelestis TaxID=2710591 RepID=UPI00194575C0|nr:hypothetical protein [Pseudomonas arcuscaelestis]